MVSKAFELLRDSHFTRWLRYQSQRSRHANYGPAAYVWVIEHANGYTHVHWLVHIPPALKLQFKLKLHSWLSSVAGIVHCAESAINIEQVTGARGLGRYMMKGIEPATQPFTTSVVRRRALYTASDAV